MTTEPLYLVWSKSHKAWWRPNSMGYCVHHSQAGRYPKAEAEDICLHGDDEICYPETDAQFQSETPRADALIAELAYQFPGTEGYQGLMEVKRLEGELTALRVALKDIASYDQTSPHGEGICPYGCDCPQIARVALEGNQSHE